MQFNTIPAITTLLLATIVSTSPVPAPVSSPEVAARAVAVARVQLNFEGESAAQADVTLDNRPQPQFATRSARTGSIVSVSGGVPLGKVQCQAYKDDKATIKVGKPFTGLKDGVFSTNGRDVTVESVRCKRI